MACYIAKKVRFSVQNNHWNIKKSFGKNVYAKLFTSKWKKKTKKNTVFFFSTHVNIDGFEAKQK